MAAVKMAAVISGQTDDSGRGYVMLAALRCSRGDDRMATDETVDSVFFSSWLHWIGGLFVMWSPNAGWLPCLDEMRSVDRGASIITTPAVRPGPHALLLITYRDSLFLSGDEKTFRVRLGDEN